MTTATLKAPRFSEAQARRLYERADAAGREAAAAIVPTPMIIRGYENQPIMDGVCGYAWVIISPGGSSFARYLKAQDLGKYSKYFGGVLVSAQGYGQSYERKSAYASAFAAVLREAGVRADAMSRLD